MQSRLLSFAMSLVLLSFGLSCAAPQAKQPGAAVPKHPEAQAPIGQPLPELVSANAQAFGGGAAAGPAAASAQLPGALPALPAQAPKAFERGAREPAPEVKLTSGPPALTETLNSALDRLAEEKALNQQLRETVASQERALAERDNKVKELTAQLETYDAKIHSMQEALEKWKADVLGFRDEMRDYEEAQIQVQQEILVLLKGFKKEAQAK